MECFHQQSSVKIRISGIALNSVTLRHSRGSSLSFNFIANVLVGLRDEPSPGPAFGLGGALDNETAHDEIIHLRVDETTVSVVRCADDRFATDVERSVHQHAAAGGF